MVLNLLYSVQVLPCWFGASEDQPCLCEVPPKTNFHETINSFLCISTFCVLFHMSDAIYFKRSPIDKASFDVKMTESIHFSTWFNHLPGLLYFCCLCACVSVKGWVFLFKIARAVALHEYFPFRLASPGIVSCVAGLVRGWEGGVEGAYTLMGYQGTRRQSPETHGLHTSQPLSKRTLPQIFLFKSINTKLKSTAN